MGVNRLLFAAVGAASATIRVNDGGPRSRPAGVVGGRCRGLGRQWATAAVRRRRGPGRHSALYL